MTIAENIRLEQEMSIIRDPLDQTKQMSVNADGSISVSPATGSVQVVSGAAAAGATPTVPPVGVSGIDNISGYKRSLLTDTSGRMFTIPAASVFATKSFSALNDYTALPVTPGMTSVSADITTTSGTFSGTLQLGYSPDSTDGANGTWIVLSGRSSSATSGAAISTLVSGTQSIRADIPANATWVRLICSSFTTGPFTGILAIGASASSGLVTLASPIPAGIARVGFMANAAVWTRESTTPVNATQTITGASKTTFNSSSGAALASSTSYGRAFAAAAGADVAGTLVIDASPDSGTTWYPVASIALAQIGGSGNFGAYIETAICEANMRARLVNGGTNQSRAYLTTRMLG